MSILEKLTLPEIRELLETKDTATLREVLSEWMPEDIADLIDDLHPDEDVVLLAALDPEVAARSFEHISPTAQEQLVRDLPESEVSRLLEGMSPDDRTALLEREPPDEIERLLMLLGPHEQRIARSLLSYGEGTVGRLMTPDFVVVKRDWTIEKVLDHVRRVGKDSETLNVVYVTDDQHRLIDDLRIREILLFAARSQGRRPYGRAVRRPVGDRSRGGCRRGLPQIRPHRPARHRRPRHPDRHRDGRRHDGRRRRRSDARDPTLRRSRSPRRVVCRHARLGTYPQAGVLARHLVRRRTVYGVGAWDITTRKSKKPLF